MWLCRLIRPLHIPGFAVGCVMCRSTLYVLLCFSVSTLHVSEAKYVDQAVVFKNVEYYTNERCGEWPHCPLADCRLLPPIVLGYCCGCRKIQDHVGIDCPKNIPCPKVNTVLCRQYNLLMDCCC